MAASTRWRWVLVLIAGFGVILVAVALVGWAVWPEASDPALQPYVHGRPPVPIVFTSRTEAASFLAAAPDGEEFRHPGKRLWQAREGRLRILTPSGGVRELTWGQRLPDGGRIIDVMSPSVSPDGTKIIFAGRRDNDHGHFRLYEVGTNGWGLRQLTGGADDPGCTAVPPLRYAADGKTMLPEDDRKRTDFDDIDPIYLPDGQIVFASSRTPDLGRGHARRSTTLWMMQANGAEKRPVTANRHNDRWPVVLPAGYLGFSLWSHNTEVVAADERSIEPYDPAKTSASLPMDIWMGGMIDQSDMRMLIKPPIPVWRPRPLFNGRIAFMSTELARSDYDYENGPPLLQVYQADGDLIASVPSARSPKDPLPISKDAILYRGPTQTRDAKMLSLATPSPCPPNYVLVSGASIAAGEPRPTPSAYGVYLLDQAWLEWTKETAPESLSLLFDDPNFVDAEPVAVYRRDVIDFWAVRKPPVQGAPGEITLANGKTHTGPFGHVVNQSVYMHQNINFPGRTTDTGANPIFRGPPADSIKFIYFYASHRDRFDDPEQPRIAGGWELTAKVPVQTSNSGHVDAWLPTGTPSVLAGFDAEGKIVSWTTDAKDSQGRQARFYAFAGDHYSGVRKNTYHFCVGCHPGHSGLELTAHPEKQK